MGLTTKLLPQLAGPHGRPAAAARRWDQTGVSSEKLGPDNLSSPARFWGSGVTGRLTPGLVTGGGMQCRLIANANLFNPTLVRKEGVSEGDA
ncbi:unnamed protein product [Gadus morhua 'NCC']